MLTDTHQDFLAKYAEPDMNYTSEDAPLVHPNTSPDLLTKIFDTEDNGENAVRHRNAPVELLHKAMNSEWSYLRGLALSHHKATPDILRQGIKDPDWMNRYKSLVHEKTPDDVVKAGLKDHDAIIANCADRISTERILKGK